MVMTNAGFDGTVDEQQFARMMYIGGAAGVDGTAAWAVTQGTGRQVSVAAQSGWAFAAGVVSRETVALTASVPTPTTGAWHVVVRRIDWTSGTTTSGVSVTLVAGPTVGSITPPATPPTTLPAGINTNAGTLFDQPLAWVFVNSSNTTLTIFDLRNQVLEARMANVEAKAAMVERMGPFTPTLTNSWTSVAGQPVQYERRNGVVYLAGRATGGNGSIFTLPVGYRPSQDIFFAVPSGGGTPPTMARVFVSPDGTVNAVSGNQPNLVSVVFVAQG